MLIVLIGTALKFYHLDDNLLWIDEVYTVQHTSGIPGSAYPARIPVNEIRSSKFYFDTYRLNKQDYNIFAQLKGLLTSTQLNPLHYPLLMVWYRIVGDDFVHFRLFSVLVFIVTVPFLLLLARKLFDSDLAGWMAAGLYAVSPYFHLFAQEARYYILWGGILVVLHYAFLQALQRNQVKWWSAYTVTASLSLYASPVSLVIIAGHAVFVSIIRKDLWQRFGISLLIVLMIYVPWALAIFFNLDEIIHALSWQTNKQFQVAFWLPFLGQLFFLISIFAFKLDYLTTFERMSANMPPDALTAFLFNMIVLVILVMSFVALFRRTGKVIRYFLLLIIIPGLLLFYVNDLIRNGMTSWWWRYLMFIGPAVILVITNFLYKHTEKGNLLSSVSYLVLAFIGISSIVTIAGARHWHIGNQMNVYLENARLIAKSEQPLLITDLANNRSMIDLMVVLRECNSDRIDILRASPGIDDVAGVIGHKDYTDIYVIYASDELIENLRSQFDGQMQKLDLKGISSIWKILGIGN